MTVQELMKQLLECPMDSDIEIAMPGQDDMREVMAVGMIPEGPFGIYKPKLVYLEIGLESR